MRRIMMASVCSSTSIMLNKLAATEDIFGIQISSPSAAPSVALTCVLLCFLPTTFYYSAFSVARGIPRSYETGL